MGIIGNYSILSKSPARFRSGNIASGDRANFSKSGSLRNRFAGDQGLGMAKFTAIPSGYNPSYTYAMAQINGGLASYKQLSTAIEKTQAQLALGINSTANLSASISETNAVLALIVALASNMSASGSVTQAQLAIILLLQAQIDNTGSFTTAELGNILGLAAQLVASMDVSNSITTLVNLSSDIGGPVELSPQGLAEELLDNQDIETGYSMRESLRLILASLAGKLSGAPGTTITIRDLNDAKDRITAIVDANGNRTSVTHDVS